MTIATTPPGPPPLGWIGFIRFVRAMQRDALGTVRGRFDAYGDLYLSGSPKSPLLVSRHPDHFYEALVTRAGDFDKRADLEPVLGRGLLTANGETWRRNRRLIQPAFRHERLTQYAETIVAAADATAETWAQTPQRNVGEDMMRLTLAVVGKALFDFDPGPDVENVANAMDVLQKATTTFDPFPAWLPTRLHRRTARALRTLDTLVFGLIHRARTDARPKNDAASLLEHLMQTEDLNDRERRDELVTLFLAGHETTSLALTWTWWLLARHPDWERQLHEEVDRVLRDRPPGAADLESLDVTRRIVSETMRLYPPVYAVPRLANRDTKLGGFEARAGTEVILWPYWAHHDPRWFPEPQRFDPDRFLPRSPGIQHPHAYMPFGAGQRTCIGRNFALMEAQLVLARLAQRFALQAADDRDPGLQPRITLGPKNAVRMVAVRRRP